MNRQNGETTRQIINAPKNAVYIWLKWDTYYVENLASYLGRSDIEFVGPDWLWPQQNWRGIRTDRVIVVDHATRLTMQQKDSLRLASIFWGQK